MKRIILIVLTLALVISVVAGCNKAQANYAFFSSYMLDSQDRNNPDDNKIEEGLLTSKALFAYRFDKAEAGTIQTVYVWDNLLRRELRLDLKQIYEALPDKDKDITIEVDVGVKIDKKSIAFEPTSELSFTVLRAIFPTESQVNSKSFRQILREMIIRLETVDYLGDTEVIAIQTIADSGFVLENKNVITDGVITEVMHLSDVVDETVPSASSEFPEEPPTLSVSDGTTTIQAWRGTFSWMLENEDGMGKEIQADSSHPLERVDDIEAIAVSENTTLSLAFETSPTSITIKRYKLNTKDHDAYEKIAANLNTIEVKAGDYLYEVIAKWENPNKAYSGTVYFAFKTINP